MRRRFMTTSKESEYMIIEALEDDFSVLLDGESDYDARIEYSIDGETWNDLKGNQTTTPVSNGTLLLFRGKYTYNANVPTHFSISKRCNLKGNCMALLGDKYAIRNKTLGGKARAFYNLFFGCTGIINVDENFLPATTLATDCYSYMFEGCTSLTTAPALPATTSTQSCYSYMFYGCTSLTTAPALPATTLAKYCYRNMFIGCTSLVTAPELPATTLADWCYSGMFDGCSKLNYIKMLATDISASGCLDNWVFGIHTEGTFVKNKNATWNVTGSSGVPSGWTIQKV